MRLILGLFMVITMGAAEKHGCEAAPPDSKTNPVTWDKEKATGVYRKNCMVCHGQNGEGGSKSSVALDTSRVKNCSDGALFWQISNGSPGLMKDYKELKEEERWQLVHFIRRVTSN